MEKTTEVEIEKLKEMSKTVGDVAVISEDLKKFEENRKFTISEKQIDDLLDKKENKIEISIFDPVGIKLRALISNWDIKDMTKEDNGYARGTTNQAQEILDIINQHFN